ncbi:MAG: HD domain-containing protein [Saprospiraceae bacterium]|nr:HD domain-containing protein [Saprospiraceae bacterium]
MNYRAAKQYIVNRLSKELSGQLHYHGLHHTLDVLRMATVLCESEGIFGKDVLLIKTAALFHDAGFVTNVHAGHEAEGCRIVQSVLPDFGYTQADIDQIKGMIMATKIPQTPNNLLEEIICDADLDYLGRADYYTISNSLFEELKAYNILHDERAWSQLQITFLDNHHFHTRTNVAHREPVKKMFLKKLREKALVDHPEDH